MGEKVLTIIHCNALWQPRSQRNFSLSIFGQSE